MVILGLVSAGPGIPRTTLYKLNDMSSKYKSTINSNNNNHGTVCILLACVRKEEQWDEGKKGIFLAGQGFTLNSRSYTREYTWFYTIYCRIQPMYQWDLVKSKALNKE